MKNESLKLINDINRAIIQVRGIYSTWSSEHGISYHEMLVLYTIREFGFCTQKQICDSYLIPRQTINNVITGLRKKEVLAYSREHSIGREKAFVLSAKGEEYVKPLLTSLDAMESGSLAQYGSEKLSTLTQLLLEYNKTLYKIMDEIKE
ncbi:MAG: hypothetical protein Q4F11_01090 [Eubacteriales bacterium]|nr:hypothetical protein [Eubacteriales bacterium]